MNVTLAQHDVVGSVHLDLVAIFRVEQHLIAGFDVANVRADCDDSGPGEALADLGSCRDQDAAAAATLPVGLPQLDENPVVEHFDREAVVVVERKFLGGHSAQRYRYRADMEPERESVRIHVGDRVTLAADVVTPTVPVGTFVVCHPHPLFGGSRHDPVVTAMLEGSVAAGWQTVRFDFRGAGDSTGEHGGGNPERIDVLAVLDSVGAVDRVVLGGYSFGADVALTIDDQRIERWICSAPVLTVFDHFVAAHDPRPTHLLAGTDDHLRPASALRDATATWHSVDITEIAGADHFFTRSHTAVTARVSEILAG